MKNTILTLKQVSELLKVTVQEARRLVVIGALPAVEIRGRLYVDRADLETYSRNLSTAR